MALDAPDGQAVVVMAYPHRERDVRQRPFGPNCQRRGTNGLTPPVRHAFT
ncbi:hypothetical protein LCGC14_1660480 [marine sediment metagenome]|uniref:Uncharacterized protein n=1 Tax=marine sediment metagenome TaxID=412755 RepID=A0A0F9KA36_9ZZZZ